MTCATADADGVKHDDRQDFFMSTEQGLEQIQQQPDSNAAADESKLEDSISPLAEAAQIVQSATGPDSSPDALAHVFILRDQILQATEQGAAATKEVLPVATIKRILSQAGDILAHEPTLLEITVPDSCQVIVVGDTHGQVHDVCELLDTFGYPSDNRMYIFNGDYVDRGAWGVEVLALLAALKAALPTRVYLLRGNHESSTCTRFYGFKAEVEAKYSAAKGAGTAAGSGGSSAALGQDAKTVLAAAKRLFGQLPLAAVIQGTTLVLHGGLFRDIPQQRRSGGKSGSGASKRKRWVPPPPPEEGGSLPLGNLAGLKLASKGGLDPDGLGSSVVATDVLWSDPIMTPGLHPNEARGVGLVFGPDITQRFLEENELTLILRSHEGPDARDKRGDMPQVLQGWALDHDTPAGKLMTVFSAPDYPQFMSASEDRYNNKGAVALLTGPTWNQPTMMSFSARQPRPEAQAYYDYEIYADTDEDPQGSSGSEGGGSVISSAAHSEGVAGDDGLQEPDGVTSAAAMQQEDGGQQQQQEAVSALMETDSIALQGPAATAAAAAADRVQTLEQQQAEAAQQMQEEEQQQQQQQEADIEPMDQEQTPAPAPAPPDITLTPRDIAEVARHQ